MSKRKTMGDQVAEQAVLIESLRAELSQCKADFRVLEAAHEQLNKANDEATCMINAGGDMLREARQEIEVLKEKGKKLEEEVKSAKSSSTYANSRAEKAEAEIEQAHAALDAIPEALPREFEQEYGKGKRALAARFIGTMLAVVRAPK